MVAAQGFPIMFGPFFSYYGPKWKAVPHLGAPQCDLLIEPFAGSACYATRSRHPNVQLYDKSDVVCDLWDFLIKCSDKDIMAIPDDLDPECIGDTTLLDALSPAARSLATFWMGYASTGGLSFVTYNNYKGYDCSVWGAHVKKRIITQKPMIKRWTIKCCSYEEIPNQRAHWHIDPPYNNKNGAKYVHGCKDIDYAHLGDWCRSRLGVVQVCEQAGAKWLPFGDPYQTQTASKGRKKSNEVVYHQPPPWFVKNGAAV